MDLLIFHRITQDEAVKALLQKEDTIFLRHVIEFAETEGVTADAVKEYIVTKLANDNNILSRLAQSGMKIGSNLYDAALSDIEKIYDTLFSGNISYAPSGNHIRFFDGYIRSVRSLVDAPDPQQLLSRLVSHYRTLGSGLLSRYIAFKFDGTLSGIAHTDTVTFDSLIGLEYQKQVLIDNTKAFVDGKMANNVLLFGDRGTGKSSSVKALLNQFYRDGLRVIEVPKGSIGDIPSLSKELADKPHKYILFLDDLSFESHDTEYRALKIAMEGQLQAHPDNILIYATSNRRHLIKENWADREGGEVHVNDNLQETLSLSERFGISLVFSAPNQREYLHIVAEMLKGYGIEINADIEKKAIVWQMNYGGRSARCAKQIVASFVANQ